MKETCARPNPARPGRGQILIGTIILIGVLLVLVPIMVQWMTYESRASVRAQKSVAAFNLAEAAVDRAFWKIKSTTAAWADAASGVAIPGYDFGTAHADIPGGLYRVKVSSGPALRQVTITGEGNDRRTGQVRAVQAIFENRGMPGSLVSGGLVTYAGALECHWGAVFSHGDIQISANAKTEYFPRKFSKQVVLGVGGHERDTNGLAPPNTDGIEWWSDHPVPDLPQPDFDALKAMAQASGTCNYRTNDNTSGVGKCVGWGGHGRCMAAGNSAAAHFNPAVSHFFDSEHHAESKNQRVWYWDGDLIITGNNTGGCHRAGIHGTVIVRGNLTLDAGDCYSYVGPVPPNAWKEYRRLKNASVDTGAADEYPADDGLSVNRATFHHGAESWSGGPPAAKTDVGIRGLVYVGGNLTVNEVTDIAGALWVVGDVVGAATGDRVLVFYDETTPAIPLKNVVLTREDWREVRPSTVPWP